MNASSTRWSSPNSHGNTAPHPEDGNARGGLFASRSTISPLHVPCLVAAELGRPLRPGEQELLQEISPELRSYASRRMDPWRESQDELLNRLSEAETRHQVCRDDYERAKAKRDQSDPGTAAVVEAGAREDLKNATGKVDRAWLRCVAWGGGVILLSGIDAALTASAIRDLALFGEGGLGLALAWLVGIVSGAIVAFAFHHGWYEEYFPDA